MTTARKNEILRRIVRETGGLAVAFSGGGDSTFLAAVARQELGDLAMAVTAVSPLYPSHEREAAASLADHIGIRHELVESNELDVPGFADNPPDRCYLCKSELFDVVRAVANRNGLPAIADGTNADDSDDYRPGRRAAAERDVLTPLAAAGLGKEEIGILARELGLPTADKPAFACLASRFPYGSRIDESKLKAVGNVEDELRGIGFSQFRVRHHGEIARIEVLADDIERLCTAAVRERILSVARESGFLYVTADFRATGRVA